MKIYELAKEIGVDSKEIVDFLKKEGADVKNHMSAVPEDMFIKVKNNFSNGGNMAADTSLPSKENSEKKTQGIKAVALPEHLLKQVEEEKAQKEKEQALKKAEALKTPDEKSEQPAEKKKKLHVKLNAENSSALRGRQQQRPAQKPVQSSQPKPAAKKWVSAKDRVPDDILEERRKKAAEEAQAAAKAAEEEALRKAAEEEAAKKAAETQEATDSAEAPKPAKKPETKTEAKAEAKAEAQGKEE